MVGVSLNMHRLKWYSIAVVVRVAIVKVINPCLEWFVRIPVAVRDSVIPHQYTYMIYRRDNRYHARNGLTGSVEYSDTDATRVIQYAIDRVCATGGRVFIRSGEYPVRDIVIQGCRDVEVVGEGWSTKLIAAGPDVTVIKIGDRTNVARASRRIRIADLYIDGSNQATETQEPEFVDRRFGIEIAGEQTESVIIENCFIYNTGSDSIYGYFPGEVIVRNNIIIGTRGYWAAIHPHSGAHRFYIIGNIIRDSLVGGIRHGRVIVGNVIINSGAPNKAAIDGGDYGAVIVGNYIYLARWKGITTITSEQYRNTIANNVILYANDDGIHVYTDSRKVQGIETIIIGNEIIDVEGNGITVDADHVVIKGNVIGFPRRHGIYLNGANYCIVSDNMIRNPSFGANNTYSGIALANGSKYNRIAGNLIRSHRENRPRHGIAELSANEDYNYIAINYIEGSVLSAILKQGTNTIVRFNAGYPTENSGVVVMSAGSTSVTVNHRLACVPSKVLVTPLGQPAGHIWVENITNTSFVIRTSQAPTSNLAIAWYAEC
jgi:hypothetical protein